MKNIGLRLVVAVAAWLSASALAGPYAYIPESSGAVAVIDADRLEVITRIELGGSPFGVAVIPGGRRAYVTNPGRSEVSIIDTAAQAVIANIPVAAAPQGIAINPAETRVFVVHSPASGNGSVSVINTENQQFVTSIPVGAGPGRVAMTPLGTRLFVSNTAGNSITVIDPINLTVLGTIATPAGPRGMAVDPAGQRLYVALSGDSATAGDTVGVIDIAGNSLVGSIRVGQRPDSLVFHPSGTRLYVTNFNSDSVSVVDAGSGAVTASVPVGAGPLGIDINPTATHVYVANSLGSTVSVLYAELPTVFHTVPVGAGPRGVGRFFGGNATLAPQNPNALSGLWWNPGESGWGIHLTQRRNTVFAAWFTYDGVGAPRWYVSSNCFMSPALPGPDNVDNSFCSGELFEVNGPRFFRDRFDPAHVVTTRVGVVQMEFRNRNSGTMSYVVGSRTRTVAIERQPIAASGPAPTTDYTDLWWNPSESGWGLGVTQQFGVMFLTWFVYEDTGRPVWYVASNCAVNGSGNGCRGTLYRTSGPAGPIASNTFDPSQVRVTAVGTIDAAFSDANNGVITYTVDGVSGSKIITRQIF